MCQEMKGLEGTKKQRGSGSIASLSGGSSARELEQQGALVHVIHTGVALDLV
jgi:hypothetical protein